MGKDAPFIPGWDCHGLPIEWKIEEQYRKKKLDKDQVPPREFRAECRAYAEHWIQVQREQFIRLGITGDWDDPYRTMDFTSEAKICEEFLKLAEAGRIYRGAKPVMWSPVEKTALAEAEVEYEDIVSTQIDVVFEIVESPIPELVGAYAVTWTTTPWTIPTNRAVAYGPDVDYVLVEADGKRLLVAETLAEQTLSRHSGESGNPDGGGDGHDVGMRFPLSREWRGEAERLRPRRHDRPPSDAPSRRLFRRAQAVPARRPCHHRCRHRPRPYGARPWRGGFPGLQGGRESIRCSRSPTTANIATTGSGSAARAR